MEGHESHSENNYGNTLKWNKVTESGDITGKTGQSSGVVGPEGEEKFSRSNKFVFPSDIKKDKSHGAVNNVK